MHEDPTTSVEDEGPVVLLMFLLVLNPKPLPPTMSPVRLKIRKSSLFQHFRRIATFSFFSQRHRIIKVSAVIGDNSVQDVE